MSSELLLQEALLLETVELCMLRNRLHREVHRRMNCALIGKRHTPEEIKAYDEKTSAPVETVQGFTVEC